MDKVLLLILLLVKKQKLNKINKNNYKIKYQIQILSKILNILKKNL